MIDTNKIRGLMAEKGISGKDMARELDITPNTFYAKMKAGVFDSTEIDKMVIVLNIENPMPIFFADFVTQDVTNGRTRVVQE